MSSEDSAGEGERTAYEERDRITKMAEKELTPKQEAEAEFNRIDAEWRANPTQELLTKRLKALARLMSR